ncbi:unnamed protein product [Camellia sinensis]
MVHDVVERRRFLGHQPELPGLLFCEAARREPRSGRLLVQIGGRLALRLRRKIGVGAVGGVNVVGFGGPAEEWGPPVGRRAFPAVCARFPVTSGGACADSYRPESYETGSHFFVCMYRDIDIERERI